MIIKDGYFRDEEGKRWLPLGMFANYFSAAYTGDTLVLPSRHGSGSIEFQRCTLEVWEHLFEFLRKEGVTAIRLFPRGDSGGSAWEGLDIGGRVNLSLLELIFLYAKTARKYGIRTMLGLFTQPECSVYCRKDTRIYWGQRMFRGKMRENATPSQKRFLENADDIVSYAEFFTDPDVRSCCHSFLDEILPLIEDNEDIYCLEIYNEMGWASPNADVQNTFRWENTEGYLDWSRDMTEHVKRMAPKHSVCISNPGVGILGHDPVQWMDAIKPDFFSLHSYPEIIGEPEGVDYASMSDMTLLYTQIIGPAMYGEWQANFNPSADEERLMVLNARDFAWLTVLSGAPGCISWRARGYGEYRAVTELFDYLGDRDLTRTEPSLSVNVSDAHEYFISLTENGKDECVMPEYKWCPDRCATDNKHRFCVKAESGCLKKMAEIEMLSLKYGCDYGFSLDGGIPLESVTENDFISRDKLIGVSEGYHVKRMVSRDGNTVIHYLRNYEPYPVYTDTKDGGKAETSRLRIQKTRGLKIDILSDDYRYELWDLDNGTKRRICDRTFGEETSHDFILLAIK